MIELPKVLQQKEVGNVVVIQRELAWGGYQVVVMAGDHQLHSGFNKSSLEKSNREFELNVDYEFRRQQNMMGTAK